MRWEFTPDEFMHIWRETNRDRYPNPLVLRSAVQWHDDYVHRTRELAIRLPHHADPDLSAALRVAADPAISLSLTGIRRQPLRAYAAIDNTVGVTLVQRPGPNPDCGANIVMEVGTPALVPLVFAAVLGNQPAGHTPPVTESLGALRRHLDSPTGRITHVQNLFRTPRSSHGHIEVRHTPRTANPTPPEYLSWFDIPHDGRYLYRIHKETLHLTSVTPETLHQEITRITTPRKEPGQGELVATSRGWPPPPVPPRGCYRTIS